MKDEVIQRESAIEPIEKTGKNAAQIISGIGTVIVSIFLLIMAIAFPFYFTDGYVSIGTDKSMFFRYVGMGFALLIVPVLIVSVTYQMDKKNKDQILHGFDDADIFACVFFVVTVVSYFLSENQGEAFWGAPGWYQGLTTQVIYFLSYFAISRFFKWEKWFLILFMSSSSIVFTLGIMNRFSVFLWEMNGAEPSFISTLGNINWFCGYWSIFFALGVGMYYTSTKWMNKVLSGGYLLIAAAAGSIQGSDSALLVYVGILIVLYFCSWGEISARKRFYETVMILCIACQGVRLFRVIFPNSMNYDSQTAKLLTEGNLTLIGFAVALILWFGFHEIARRGFKMKRYMKFEKNAMIGILVMVSVTTLYLVVKNTILPGSIGNLSDISLFTFNEDWGSKRGATWTAGMRVFNDQPFWRKLIGIGPDSFAYGVYAGNSSAAAEVMETFGSARLTNAHNEWITVLVNTGVLGMLSFIGFQVTKAYKYIKSKPQNPFVFSTGLILVAYMMHNQVSFQQVLNGPLIYIFVGIGEAIWIKNYIKN